MSHQHSFEFGDRRVKTSEDASKTVDNSMQAERADAAIKREVSVEPVRSVTALVSSDPRVAPCQEVVEAIFGSVRERRFAVRYWDGTFEPAGQASTPEFTLSFNRAGALRRMFLPATELSIVESYISGDLDIDGNMEAAMYLGDALGKRLQSPANMARLLKKLVALPKDSNDVSKDVHSSRYSRLGRALSIGRHGGEKAIQYHYDVGNDFYQLFLDPQMVYSCGYFKTSQDDLATAQEAKLDHICRKLRLEHGMRYLDVGCGWGALIMHAAQNYGVDATGITLSKAQAELATQRIKAAGLQDRCRVELRDYRDLPKKPEFDRASSVGMMEHVHRDLQPLYFDSVYRVLKRGGVFLNHCIVSVARARPESLANRVKGYLWRRDAFIDKYVFPEGRLVPAAHVIASAERVGFELRDVESLREHYVMTLRHWVKALQSRNVDAIRLAGERIYRVWRLYMSSSIYAFASGRINIMQILLSKPDEDGRTDIPLTRDYMYYPALTVEVPDSAAA